MSLRCSVRSYLRDTILPIFQPSYTVIRVWVTVRAKWPTMAADRSCGTFEISEWPIQHEHRATPRILFGEALIAAFPLFLTITAIYSSFLLRLLLLNRRISFTWKSSTYAACCRSLIRSSPPHCASRLSGYDRLSMGLGATSGVLLISTLLSTMLVLFMRDDPQTDHTSEH